MYGPEEGEMGIRRRFGLIRKVERKNAPQESGIWRNRGILDGTSSTES
jgi:hypothetical protein